MVWKYVSGDNYNLDDLEDFKKFFLQDLVYAHKQMEKTKALQKYGLPGWRYMYVAAQVAVEESQKNVDIVNMAIEEHKRKQS